MQTCPMSGRCLPELVNGQLQAMVDEITGQCEADILFAQHPAGVQATADDVDLVMDDFRRARSTMATLLAVKTDFLQRLPVLFCRLADACGESARDCALCVVDAWRQDPRQDVHHRLSWELMRPQSAFSKALDDFIAGAPRRSLPDEVRRQIAAFRFVSAVESSIEGKHSRVALEQRNRHIGGMRISLANRLPMLERWLRIGHVTCRDLLECFVQARSLRRASVLLGIDQHPILSDERLEHSVFSTVGAAMSKVIYHCDLESMFRPKASVAAEHSKKKREDIRAHVYVKPSFRKDALARRAHTHARICT